MKRAEQSFLKFNEETGEDKIYLADGTQYKPRIAFSFPEFHAANTENIRLLSKRPFYFAIAA